MLSDLAPATAVTTVLLAAFGYDALRRRPKRLAVEDRIRHGTLSPVEDMPLQNATHSALGTWLERAHRAGVGTAMLMSAAVMGAFAVGGLLYALIGGDIAPILSGLVGAILAPIALVRFRENARRSLLDQQFEQALEQLVAGLRAGATLHQAFEHVASEAPMPLAAEFRIVAQRMGVVPVDEAIMLLSERMPGPATRLFVTAVAFQSTTGGGLSDVLLQVADALREQREFRQQALAATAEGRMTAWLMAGMPLFLLGSFRVMAPGYLATLTDTTWGQLLTLGALGMVAIGVVVVQRMALAVAGDASN